MNGAPQTARLRDRIEELERLIGMRMVPPRPWGLTRREADVLGILLRRQVMTHTQLFEAIWGGDSERNIKIVEVVVCKLRTKLRPHGIAIRTEYGLGYFIPPASKATARALIAAHERECTWEPGASASVRTGNTHSRTVRRRVSDAQSGRAA
jgi:DNA-binding winged helix-turn-helix (wHTH) protein